MRPANAANYEFNQDEEGKFLALSTGLGRLGVSLAASGGLLALYMAVAYFDPPSLVKLTGAPKAAIGIIDYGLWAAIAALVMVESVLVSRLVQPIRRIVGTQGSDIDHLMEFVVKLTSIVRFGFIGMLGMCLLIALSLGLSILVF